MMKHRLSAIAVAALVALGACQGKKEAPAAGEPSGTASPVPDAPPPAISNPASPSPVGTDVGAVGTDATATAPRGDTSATAAAHP